MGVTAPVTSWVWAPRVGRLVLWRGIGRSGAGARAPKESGEKELSLEARGGWARRNSRPRPKGSSEPCFGPEAKEPDELGPVLRWLRIACLLCDFLLFWFGYLFLWYPTVAPEPLEGWRHPFKGSILRDHLSWSFFYFLRGVRASAPAGCSPRALWRNGVIPLKAFTPEYLWSGVLRGRLRALYT